MTSRKKYLVAVVGAGPAGLFAAKHLASDDVHVVIFNRDIKPGGLAEYGIYHDKYKMKEGLRKQFRQILASPNIEYFGNVSIGQSAGVSIDDLRGLGFQAILVTVGAQGTKWLGLPGEDLIGVYHAKDIVYHYNHLPPYAAQHFEVGRRVAVVGVGNVMLDMAHWFVRDRRVDEVIAVARRGPLEVKFDKAEMELVGSNLDLAALDRELERVRPIMEAIGQDVTQARAIIVEGVATALEPVSGTRFRFDFLASPTRIAGDDRRRVVGLEVEDNTLVAVGQDTKAKSLDSRRVIDCDTVVFAIGDKVDESFGLPVQWNSFVKHPQPRFPIEGISYEAYDHNAGQPVEGVFVAGWSREASTGLVGAARKDGTNGAKALAEYLKTLVPTHDGSMHLVADRLAQLDQPVVTKDNWRRLEAVERDEALKRGLDVFKFDTNEDMLAAMGLAVAQPA